MPASTAYGLLLPFSKASNIEGLMISTFLIPFKNEQVFVAGYDATCVSSNCGCQNKVVVRIPANRRIELRGYDDHRL